METDEESQYIKKLRELDNVFKNYENLSNEKYLEIKLQLQDLQAQNNLTVEGIYKDAYKNNCLNICIEKILDMGSKYGSKFKSVFLISDCLKNPLGFKYERSDAVDTISILDTAIKIAKNEDYYEGFHRDLSQCRALVSLLYSNNEKNSKRLRDSDFSNYTLSEQLRMICIFMQDQTRLLKKELVGHYKKNNFITGMEMEITDKEVSLQEGQKVSLGDNYEGMLERLDVLIKYLYATKNIELNFEDAESVNDIIPYDNSIFEKINYIATQRVMYEDLESKFRYSKWELIKRNTSDGQDIIVFRPTILDKYKSHIVAGMRRKYRLRTYSYLPPKNIIEDPLIAINELGKNFDFKNFEKNKIDKVLFEKAKIIAESYIEVYKTYTKPFYLGCSLNGFKVVDLISGYEFLFTLSQIYMTKTLSVFVEKDRSNYKYLAPKVEVNYIVEEFARLYNLNRNDAKKIISCFILDNSVRNGQGDIFSRPLIKTCKDKVLFCENLITSLNLERCIEKLLIIHNVNLAPMGVEFEKKLLEELSGIDNVQVNTKKISFLAYDGKNVEFDFIGTIDDYLMLFEFKSVTIPYDDKELSNNEKTIKEGVAQVLRRCEVIKHDWDKIRESVDIELPQIPHQREKIIKLVCTNICDFTSLEYEGVKIADESTLLKYFTDPYVSIISHKKNIRLNSTEKIWKNEKPEALEFIQYLNSPVTSKYISDCLKEEVKFVPHFKDDLLMGFVDLVIKEDPVEKVIKARKYNNCQKVGRNAPCPCGSGKKFKKCCLK